MAHETASSLRANLQAAQESVCSRSTEASVHMEAAKRLRADRDSLQTEFAACKEAISRAVSDSGRFRAGVCCPTLPAASMLFPSTALMSGQAVTRSLP
jgi:hypothetical protein